MIDLLEKTDLIKLFSSNKLDGIVHQTNIERVMGAGIAKKMAELFPACLSALQASNGILGEVSQCTTEHGFIFNVTAQSIKGMGRKTNYEAFFCAMQEVERRALLRKDNFRLGIPYNIGCGYGGGDWQIVSAMLSAIFEKSTVQAVICKLD